MNTTSTVGPDGGTSQPAVTPPSDKWSLPSGRMMALVAGIVLVLVGGAMLAAVGWQYWGTDIAAKRKQADLRAEIHARWEYPTLSDLLGPQSSSASLGSADALIRVPAFGADF